jgi:chromosome segregation ATPase
MKHTLGYIALVILALALGIGWMVRSRNADDLHKQDQATILALSRNVKDTSLKLDEAHGVISNLEKDVADRNARISTLSTDLSQTTNSLLQTRNDLDAQRKSALEELARRDARISELEAQNLNLDHRAIEMTNALNELTAQIADTKHKLAAAEGDKVFLASELKRLMSEKEDLERKFRDLEVLRAQVKRLKEEVSVARRLAWIRSSFLASTERKGASMLMNPPAPPPPPKTNANYDLNVEVRSDGSVQVIPPLPKVRTNAPGR